MATVDWTPFDPNMPAGIYLAEVEKCEEKRSKNGDLMFAVKLRSVDFGRDLCMDWYMLEGPARNMGTGKLKALGFTGTEPSIDPVDLLGRRCFVNVAPSTYRSPKTGEESVSMKPTKCDGASLGYWPESAPPAGVCKPDPDTTPF